MLARAFAIKLGREMRFPRKGHLGVMLLQGSWLLFRGASQDRLLHSTGGGCVALGIVSSIIGFAWLEF